MTHLVHVPFWRLQDPRDAEGAGSKTGAVVDPLFEPISIPRMAPNVAQKLVEKSPKNVQLVGPLVFEFCPLFCAKTKQNKPRWPLNVRQESTILRRCVSICVLANLWNTEPPKRAPRQPRSLTRWIQTTSKSFSKTTSKSGFTF